MSKESIYTVFCILFGLVVSGCEGNVPDAPAPNLSELVSKTNTLPEKFQASDGISWFAAVRLNLTQGEYKINEQDGVFRFHNRAQNLRGSFDAKGWHLAPAMNVSKLKSLAALDAKALDANRQRAAILAKREAPEWGLTLRFASFGRRGGELRNSENAKTPELKACDARCPASADPPSSHSTLLEWKYRGVTEYFRNTAEGLEHGFVVENRPSGTGELLLALDSEGLRARLEDAGQKVVFHDDQADRVVYSHLSVKDAEGTTLPARMDVENGRVLLLMDDSEASYPLVVDPLATAAVWTAEGMQPYSQFGFSVASAGDVNRDGYADVLVGAPNYDDGAADKGRAFLFLGSAQGLSPVPIWTVAGEQGGAQFGFSVASAGDVNNDGFSDFIIGAPYHDGGQENEGKAYLFMGASGYPSVTPRWTAESDQANALFGFSVASAGDVNGGNRGDVIIGAPYYDGGQTDEGRVYVYSGTMSGLTSAPIWTAESDQASALFGYSVSSAGDLNNDGYGDIIIGAPYYDSTTFTDAGRVYLYGGSSTGPTTAAAPIHFIYEEGTNANAALGYSVAFIGETTGHGVGSIAIGAPRALNTWDKVESGQVLLLEGAPYSEPPWEQFKPRFAAILSGSNKASSLFGSSVASAGDVNGDGFNDIIVGEPAYENKGRSYLYLGGSSSTVYSPDWHIDGNEGGASLGASVASAGDVNGDGFADLIVGAPGYTGGGMASVFHGKAFGYMYSGLEHSGAFGATSQENAHFGKSVASAGDVNGDGYDDLIIGAPDYDDGEADEGGVFLYFGSDSVTMSAPAWSSQSDHVGAHLGRSVAAAGDVNGDGYADVIVGAPDFDNDAEDAGYAAIYLGSADGLAATPAWRMEGDKAGAHFGFSMASAGDVNGDGYGDVIIGAYGYTEDMTEQGRVFLYTGSATGLSLFASWTMEGDTDGARFGYSVASAGDVNGDGYGDVVIGAPGYANGQGQARIYLGAAAGLRNTPAWTMTSEQVGGELGYSVASAGDVNGDTYGDVIVGEPGYDGTQTDAGRALVYLGAPAGLATTPAWSATSDLANARFGASVASAGDMNGDSRTEVIVRSDLYMDGTPYNGRVFIFQGSAEGLSQTPEWTSAMLFSRDEAEFSIASAGDVNGDGYADVIFGLPLFSQNNVAGVGRSTILFGTIKAKSMLPQQFRVESTTPVQPGGFSNSETSIVISMLKTTTIGRAKVRLEWEIKPANVPFDGTHLQSTYVSIGIETHPIWSDSGDPRPAERERLNKTLTGLSAGTTYHWRARLLYQNGGWSRWAWFAPAAPGGQGHFRLTKCGDGIRAGLEACDAPNGCCKSDCTVEAMGTPCDADASGCTASDSCDTAGGCAAGAVVDCSEESDSCNTGVCRSTGSATYRCEKDSLPNEGLPCNLDSNGCTLDVCSEGTCMAGNAPDCSGLNDACNAGVCSPTGDISYICTKDFASFEGLACDADSSGCTTNDACRSGICTAGPAPDCSSVADACNGGVCYPLGAASYECVKDATAKENAGCDDGNLCTVNDLCVSGECVSASKDCADTASCTVDSCDPTDGHCVHVATDTLCDDANPCTTDLCDATSDCTHTALADWTACGESGHACFAGVCETLAANDTCATATPLRVGQVQNVDLSGYHAYLAVPKTCTGAALSGPDAFFLFAYDARKAYTLSVVPNAATDVAVVLWKDCDTTDTCVSGANAAILGATENVSLPARDEAGSLIVQVLALAPAKEETPGFAITIEDVVATDGDGESQEEDSDSDAESDRDELDGDEEGDALLDGDSELDYDSEGSEDGDRDSSDAELSGDQDSDSKDASDVDMELPARAASGGGCQNNSGSASVLLISSLLGIVLARRRRTFLR